MSVRVEVACVNPDGSEQRREVLTIEDRELTMETLGLTLSEGKALLAGVQALAVAHQVHEHLEQRRVCPHCQCRYTSKDSGTTLVSTVFGRVEVLNPRWNRCACQADGPGTFRPMRTWLNGQTSPEMLYLETKWASLIPFARVADLLKEVLPVGDTTNQETVRGHLYATAERIEQERGEARQLNLFEGSEEDWEQQPLPDGPITVGIDGGYVRAAHKQGWFEVIAGRSVVAFRRDEDSEVSSAKCFGYVQTYDEKPRRRLWELMKSQGMQENQQVVFMSDGGENVRRVQEYLHPFSEHLIDWFHITMRAGQSPIKLARSNELAKEAILPAGAFKLQTVCSLVSLGFDGMENHATQQGEVGRGVILARAAGVLPHHEVEYPVCREFSMRPCARPVSKNSCASITRLNR